MDQDERIARPDVIVADAGPLIHLALADALPLLHAIGGRVVVPDMVAFEVTCDPTRPGAATLAAWLEAGRVAGSTMPVAVDGTYTGRLFAAARRSDPAIQARGAGERVADTEITSLVVYETGRVPRIVANQGMDADIAIMTTRALPHLAQDLTLLPDAVWRRIVSQAPTADPAGTVVRHRRTPDGRA